MITNANKLQNDSHCVFYLPFKSSVTSEQSQGKSESHVITNNGSVAITTVGGKPCASFNGTNQYLTIPDSADWDMASLMCIYLEFYLTSSPIPPWSLISHNGYNTSANGGGWFIGFDSDNTARVQFFTSAGAVKYSLISDTNVFSLNVWNNLYVSRQSGTMKIFCNGAKIAESDAFTGYDSASAELLVAAMYQNGSISQFTPCYIRNLSIHKGIARFTRNFTPQDRLI